MLICSVLTGKGRTQLAMPAVFEARDFKKMSGEIPKTYMNHNRQIIRECGIDTNGDGVITFREFSWWWCSQFDLWEPGHKVSAVGGRCSVCLSALRIWILGDAGPIPVDADSGVLHERHSAQGLGR